MTHNAYTHQACDFFGLLYKSPFASKVAFVLYPCKLYQENFLERRGVATKEGSTCSLYCVQTSSFLFLGMWSL